ncbi:MAG: helix-turn-helix domain-containing protein [Candidatus Eremiobacterota bacterium]
MENEYNIKEISSITGKSHTTIYRLIKSGKLPSFVVKEDGIHHAFHVKKEDLEAFLGKKIEDMKSNEIHDEIHMKSSEFHLTEETLQEAIVKSFSYLSTSLMKPIEEQAIYRLGILENEVKHLQAEKETLRQENELLREQVKALPDFRQEKDNYKAQVEILEKEKEDLLSRAETIQKEKEEQERKAEGLNQVLLDNANNIKELATEKDKIQSILKEHEATVKEKERAIKDIEEIHQQELKKLEDEKKQIAEAWKKELEQAKRPWYKFW